MCYHHQPLAATHGAEGRGLGVVAGCVGGVNVEKMQPEFQGAVLLISHSDVLHMSRTMCHMRDIILQTQILII